VKIYAKITDIETEVRTKIPQYKSTGCRFIIKLVCVCVCVCGVVMEEEAVCDV
jgi:hypothetical protein